MTEPITDPNELVIIHWRYPPSGETGHGSLTRRSAAEAWIAYCRGDSTMSAFEHWIETAAEWRVRYQPSIEPKGTADVHS